MTDKIMLEIDMTEEEHQHLEALAKERGYPTPADYIRALIAEADDQAYFWTEVWQVGEREADEDIVAGRLETFDTMDDLIADLMDDDE